jgi:hypothetical protein
MGVMGVMGIYIKCSRSANCKQLAWRSFNHIFRGRVRAGRRTIPGIVARVFSIVSMFLV